MLTSRFRVLALGLILLAPAFGQGTSSADNAIVGTWVVTVSPTGMPSFRAYNVFHSDGTSMEFDNSNAPSAQTPAVGPWVRLAPRQFAFTEINQIFDPQGNYAGELKVKATLTVDTPGNSFRSSFTFIVFDTTGAIVFQGDGTAVGQRVGIE